MNKDKYIRTAQFSVTNFLFYDNEFLFLKRSKSKRVDPGKLNGIGRRLEPKENFLDAAIRETEEETGYKVSEDDVQLSGMVRLEAPTTQGYSEDWSMGFFKIRVESKRTPIGMNTEDGELMWIHKDRVLDSDYELVDDLYYCFKEIVDGDKLFFLNVEVGDDFKVQHHSMNYLPQSNKFI